MQLDIEENTPASACSQHKILISLCICTWQMLALGPLTPGRQELFRVFNFGLVTPDKQMDKQKTMHMSSLCFSTGVLKWASLGNIPFMGPIV